LHKEGTETWNIESWAAAALRATRANRDFYTDEKRIRIEITVMVRSKDGLGVLLSKIVDCARMCFSSARNR
jgi:acetolactate synthase regulatory subunit